MRAWTSTILRRVFLTGAIRTKRRGLHLDTDLDEPLQDVATHVAPDQLEIGDPLDELIEELDDDVKHALDRVPALYRKPLYLQVFKNLSCGEIARWLGVPEGTVMSRIHRARLRLRSGLAHLDPARGRTGKPARLASMRQIADRKPQPRAAVA